MVTPPGTEALGRVFAAADAPVLVLFDEVLNFVNRHRTLADPFHAFIQNLTVAMTATTCGAAVISLPRSQVEMTDFDLEWQDKITKLVRRVAKDLIANDETEISEVVRRRLFDDIGPDRVRKRVSKAFADWCVDGEMMRAANAGSLFMHCLLAHRGEEVTAEVMDGPQSVVWDEAENRLHVQKALLEYLVLGRIETK